MLLMIFYLNLVHGENYVHCLSLGGPKTKNHPLITLPPLGCNVCPDMKLLSWLARKTKQVAISDG
jgi:hypothetical protein